MSEVFLGGGDFVVIKWRELKLKWKGWAAMVPCLTKRARFSRLEAPQPCVQRSQNHKASLVNVNSATNMPATVRNTVDRLDKPSAYYQARVSNSLL